MHFSLGNENFANMYSSNNNFKNWHYSQFGQMFNPFALWSAETHWKLIH